jgi:DNA polymerase kappa
MKAIVAEYDQNFISMGLDEVNLDVTDYLQKQNQNNHEGR